MTAPKTSIPTPETLQGYVIGLQPIAATLWNHNPYDKRTREGRDWQKGRDLGQLHRREKGHEWAMRMLKAMSPETLTPAFESRLEDFANSTTY